MGEGGASDPTPAPIPAGRIHYFIGPPEKILQKIQPALHSVILPSVGAFGACPVIQIV
jgi:hypothetical protein